MKFQHTRELYKRLGFRAALYDAAYRGINKICVFQKLKGMIATEESLVLIELPEDSTFEVRFLTKDELFDCAKNPTLEMDERFLNDALDKGDFCLAILDKGTVTSYGWYSNKPTIILEDLSIFFSADWMYMYKGFTHPDYRGMRLHAVGMCYAASYFTKQGFKGLISYVESNNFYSLNSITRMGYKIFGSVYVLKLFSKFFSISSAACKPYQFAAKRH